MYSSTLGVHLKFVESHWFCFYNNVVFLYCVLEEAKSKKDTNETKTIAI